MPRGEAGDVVLGKGARPRNGIIKVVDHFLDGLHEVPARDVRDVEGHSLLLGDPPCVPAFVVALSLREPPVEGHPLGLPVETAPQGGDDPRIGPSAEVGADGHVAANVKPHGLFE